MCCSFYYDICPWFNPVQLDILTSNSKKESAHWAVDVMAQMYACWLSGWLRCNFWTVFILSGRLYINIWPIEYYKEPPWDRSSLSWLWALQWNEEIHKAVWDEDKQWTGLSFLRVHLYWTISSVSLPEWLMTQVNLALARAQWNANLHI